MKLFDVIVFFLVFGTVAGLLFSFSGDLLNNYGETDKANTYASLSSNYNYTKDYTSETSFIRKIKDDTTQSKVTSDTSTNFFLEGATTGTGRITNVILTPFKIIKFTNKQISAYIPIELSDLLIAILVVGSIIILVTMYMRAKAET